MKVKSVGYVYKIYIYLCFYYMDVDLKIIFVEREEIVLYNVNKNRIYIYFKIFNYI